jgi:hypothetical protein
MRGMLPCYYTRCLTERSIRTARRTPGLSWASRSLPLSIKETPDARSVPIRASTARITRFLPMPPPDACASRLKTRATRPHGQPVAILARPRSQLESPEQTLRERRRRRVIGTINGRAADQIAVRLQGVESVSSHCLGIDYWRVPLNLLAPGGTRMCGWSAARFRDGRLLRLSPP